MFLGSDSRWVSKNERYVDIQTRKKIIKKEKQKKKQKRKRNRKCEREKEKENFCYSMKPNIPAPEFQASGPTCCDERWMDGWVIEG